MSEHDHTIAVVMTCMDCRLHRPEAEHYRQLCELLEVDDCYIETEAGPDGAVIHDEERSAGAVKNLQIIEDAKNPKVMAICAHYDCAGHPVSDGEHDQDVVKAAEQLSKEVYGESGKVIPLIAYQNEGDGPTWGVKKLS